VDGCQSWKLAQILLQLAPETRAGIQHGFPALDSSASFRQVCHGHYCHLLAIIRLEFCITNINHWMSVNRLELTMDKTELIWAGRKDAVTARSTQSLWEMQASKAGHRCHSTKSS